MKLLHTSDWHLGQQFMGKSRDAEHQQFLAWLIQQIDVKKPDALIVAGDIFDTTTPPSYARRRFHDFLENLIDSPVTSVVIIAGNHDSVAVLNESAKLLRKLNVYVIAEFDCQRFLNASEEQEQQYLNNILIPVFSATNVNQTVGFICALPYLRSRDLLASQAEESITDKTSRIQQAIVQTYEKAFAISREMMAAQNMAELPLVMTGHLTTLGSSVTESVREIYVGNLEGLATSNFPPADYIALGHIHKRQPASQRQHIHYSGSPIPLSFDEAAQQKSLLDVSVKRDGDARVTQVENIDIPSWQTLKQIRGPLAELENTLHELKAQLAQAEIPQQAIWLQIDIEGSQVFDNLYEHLQGIVDGCPIEILRIRRVKQQHTSQSTLKEVHLQELTPNEVFHFRLAQDEHLDTNTRQRLLDKFAQLEMSSRQNKKDTNENRTA